MRIVRRGATSSDLRIRIASIMTTRAGAVVRGAGAGVPGIEVRAEHHDLALLVRAGDLRDRVVLRRAVVEEVARGRRARAPRGTSRSSRRDDAAVVLGRHDERRAAVDVGSPSIQSAGPLHGERVLAPARRDDRQGLLLREELVPRRDAARAASGTPRGRSGRAGPGSRTRRARPSSLSSYRADSAFSCVLISRQVAEEDDLAGELALVLLEVFLRRRPSRAPRWRARRRWSPASRPRAGRAAPPGPAKRGAPSHAS